MRLTQQQLEAHLWGVFANPAKALNFEENIRKEALIDGDALKATVRGEVARCMESFKGITVADTRECLLAALRAIKDPDAAKIFEHNFKGLERFRFDRSEFVPGCRPARQWLVANGHRLTVDLADLFSTDG